MSRIGAGVGVVVLLALLVGVGTASLGAQERDPPVPADTSGSRAPDSVAQGVGPGGAFLRAMVIPGWGHAAVGAYTRGGFYFAAEAGTAWMLFKTLSFLDAARDKRDALEADVEARIRAQGITDPDSVAVLLEEDEGLQAAESLVNARKAQREDWLALGIFLLLLGGADAFVSSHLADFPQPVDLNANVAPAANRVEISVSIPWEGPGG